MLLPTDQQPILLPSRTLAGDGIERMLDNRFSQIPVTDDNQRIIGVFTWKSFSTRVADLASTKIKPTELPIRDLYQREQLGNGQSPLAMETIK
ncbi:CBS domain-containing protein [Novipirellula aureliae]|uniref:CBS domain-containing protein n=1 Tax=Novipirellula aureliae TaxID=2527966 RepID=UPI0018CDDE5F|nr:CBS domain-containing protein [Novipirellula aureliae]